MRTEILLPGDPKYTEPCTYRSPGDDIHVHTYLPSTRLVETASHHSPSLVLLAPLITTAQYATFHCTTSESNADSLMTVIEDTHTTHEIPRCIDTRTTNTHHLPLPTPEHTAVPVEVHADV